MSKSIFLPNGMEAVKDEYTDFPLDEFNQNPFIQALPPIADKKTIIKKLSVTLTYHASEKDYDAVYRQHMVQRLYQLFQHLPIHLKVWEMVHSLIIQGYIARNPFDKSYKQYINETGKQIINRSYDINSRSNFRTTASCGTFIGFSGMGKSTTTNRVLSNLPHLVVHNEYKGVNFTQIQVVWIKLDAPPTANIKALCLQFFMKIDELLGTNNYKKYVSRNMSVDSMLPLLGQLAHNIGLGLLIIDEIQHLRNRGAEQIMNFFVNLINSGVNVLLIGTPGSYRLFKDELRIARRLTGNSEVIYNNMDYNNEFKFLLESIWKYQWTKKKANLNKEICNLFYEETQGISDLMVKLFAYSQQYAIESGKEELTPSLIKRVSRERFKLMKPMIEAVKSGNPYKIEKYEDIKKINVNPVKKETPFPLKKKRNEDIHSTKNVSIVTPYQKNKVKMDLPKNRKENEYKESDLRVIFKQKKELPPYEQLLNKGIIDGMSEWMEEEWTC